MAQFEYSTNIPPHKTHIPLISEFLAAAGVSAITIFDGDVHKVLHRVVFPVPSVGRVPALPRYGGL